VHIGCWGIALVAFCGFVLHFNESAVGLFYLLSVIAVAIVCGSWQATIAFIFAALCLNYFFWTADFCSHHH
jgi:K+-sensing histidine kinase KdpD